MRYAHIDGFRGLFLIFMMVVHANRPLDTWLGRLNHHYFGFVEDAQGFVFISGLVVGLVYGGRLLRHGPERMQRDLRQRIGFIGLHQISLILLFLTAALVLGAWGILPDVLAPYRAEPVLFSITSLLMLSASMDLGILPMYLWFMCLTPLALKALRAGKGPVLLCLSVLAWTAGQTGLVGFLSSGLETGARAAGHHLTIGLFFNLLGWQSLYFAGLWLGFILAEGRLTLDWLRAPVMTWVALLALVGVVAFGVLDRIVYWQLFGNDFSMAFLAKFPRRDFSIIHLVNFAVDLYLITWILVAGRESGIKGFAMAARGLDRLVQLRPLVYLGQHSLQVFTFHLVIVYVLDGLFRGQAPGQGLGSLLLIGAVGALWLPAWLHACYLRRGPARRGAASA